MTGALISAIIKPSQARRTDGAGTYCEMKIRKGVEHMKKVYAAGEVLIDFIAGRKGEADNADVFYRNAGGAPANVAVCVSKLGGNSAVITKLGNDMFGKFLKETLEKAGVDTEYVRFTDEANTALAFVSLDENGERSFSFYRKPSADMLLGAADVADVSFDTTDVLHFGSVDLIDAPVRKAHDALIEKARKSGATVSFDPNLRYSLWKSKDELLETVRRYIPLADVIKVSEEELADITGEADMKKAAVSLLGGNVKLAIVTMGAAGATAYTKEAEVYVPSEKAERVADTTGAGDSFVGATLYQLVENGFDISAAALKRILIYANKTAGYVVGRAGAIPAMPTGKEIFGK